MAMLDDQYILSRFQFRLAENNDTDFDTYYRIKCDKKAVEFSGFNSAPDRTKFYEVYQRIMSNDKQVLLFFMDTEKDNQICSTFHYEILDEERVEGLGYNVFPEYRGNRLGWVMMHKVNTLCKEQGFKYRISYVAESNLPSIKNLEKSGACPTGNVVMKTLAAFDREERFLEYVTLL